MMYKSWDVMEQEDSQDRKTWYDNKKEREKQQASKVEINNQKQDKVGWHEKDSEDKD